jgi:RNA-directed DNA polymerase
MGLISWFLQLLGWRQPPSVTPLQNSPSTPLPKTSSFAEHVSSTVVNPTRARAQRRSVPKSRIRLVATRRRLLNAKLRRRVPAMETKGSAPYRYARYGSRTGHYLDLSRDGDSNRLQRYGLPHFQTPEDVADWVGVPLNRVAWLVHRFSNGRPETEAAAHYHFRWVKKRLGGWRLIESPKSLLKEIQSKILHGLLDKVPVHAMAHGFVKGRSILTNAHPHVGQAILIKFDLANFYTTVSFSRVVAIFRSLGYSREVAIWLGLLTTSAVPGNLGFQEQGPYALVPYLRRHLPQGAPTSPALANLSAFGLDVRLSGLAKSFGATYTRYADDLTFSGPHELTYALRKFIPLVEQIVRQERFSTNGEKRRVLRSHQRQAVTGVIVNEKLNVARVEFDRLKAILTNSARHGPSTQNHQQVDDFYHHLQGRIAHVSMLNPERGQKLLEMFRSIDWKR